MIFIIEKRQVSTRDKIATAYLAKSTLWAISGPVASLLAHEAGILILLLGSGGAVYGDVPAAPAKVAGILRARTLSLL